MHGAHKIASIGAVLLCSLFCFAIEPSADEIHPRFRVQNALKSMGYYYGPIDGIFGSGTRNAIMRFQSSVGQPVTGNLTSVQSGYLVFYAKRKEAEFAGAASGLMAGILGAIGQQTDNPRGRAMLDNTAALAKNLAVLSYARADDQFRQYEAILLAIQSSQKRSWFNPQSNSSGVVEPMQSYYVGRNKCAPLRITETEGGRTITDVQVDGCIDPDGNYLSLT